MSRHARNTAVFSVLTLLSRLTGLLRVMGMAAVLGSGRASTGRLNDAYQLANTIPNILYEFIMGGVLSAVFIPLLVRAQERNGKSSPEAWRVANLLLGCVGALLAGVAALGVVIAPQVIGLMTFVAPAEQAGTSRELAAYFLRFFAPQMLFYGLNAVFMAILNSHGVFAITAAAPILNNLVMLVTLYGFHSGWIGLAGLGFGTTAGVAAMALVQVPWLLKVGMPIRPRFTFRDPVILGVTALGIPVVGVSIANFIGTVIRANLLYTVPGGFTTYTFSFILIMMPYGVMAVSVATVLYPAMSRCVALNDWKGFRDMMSQGFRWTMLVMLPVAIGLCVLAEPLTRILFERGQFTYADTQFTTRFLAWYALSILPYSLVIFATRAFYAVEDTRTPAWVNIAGVAANVGLNILLLWVMGIPGIAFASVLTYTATTAASMVLLWRRFGAYAGRDFGLALARMLGAGVLMALALGWGMSVTRPKTVIVEQGLRAPVRLPATAAQGNALSLSDQRSLDRFWEAWATTSESKPSVDFGRESLVVFFGPQSPTTATLRIRNLTHGGDGVLSASISVHRLARPDSQPSVFHLPSRPAYLVAKVAPPIREVHTQFVLTDDPPPGRMARLLNAPEAVRLILLVMLGAVVYLGAAWILGSPDLRALSAVVRRRVTKR